MFDTIAPRYDLANRLLSLGIDQSWRRAATRAVFAKGAMRVLDLATGTADLALMQKRYKPEAQVSGLDFSQQMLEVGRRKVKSAGLELNLLQGDALELPFADASFDAVSVAYGLRNFADIPQGLREAYRVLAPGGRMVILEFPPPPKGLLGQAFRVYFFKLLPLLGGLLTGERAAYSYLPASVENFLEPRALAAALQEVGFIDVHFDLQTLGVSALHTGEKPR